MDASRLSHRESEIIRLPLFGEGVCLIALADLSSISRALQIDVYRILEFLYISI